MQDLCWKVHDSAQSFVLYLYSMYELRTNKFLLVCSSVQNKQILCFVQGQGQKQQQHTTKNFDEFHNHSPLLTMGSVKWQDLSREISRTTRREEIRTIISPCIFLSFSLTESPPRGLQIKWLPTTNNGLPMRIISCSCVIRATFSRENWQIAWLSCQEVTKTWK